MHSSIIEIRTHRIDKDEWATESDFYDDCGSMLDWCQDLSDEEREDYINGFTESELFQSLFSKGDEPDAIIYNGKLDLLKSKWYESIQAELNEVVSKKLVSSYRLTRRIKCPLDSDILFCLPEWCGSRANYPIELLEWLSHFKEGDVLYICGVLKYHF